MPSSLDHLRAAQAHMMRARNSAGVDAGELVRGWSAITRAARAAHDNLQAPDPSRTIERIELMSTTLDASGHRQHWPESGRRSAALAPVHAALTAASHATPPASYTDAETAHRLLASIVWVGAELVAERARDHGFDLAFHRAPDSGPAQLAAHDVFQRMAAVQTLAMTAAFRPDLPAQSPSAELGAALGRWDVVAHRALLTERSTVVLHHVASLEVATFDAFRAATTRAYGLGVIDSLTADRIDPAIAGAATAWRDVEKIAAEFSFGHSSPSRSIMAAGEEVRGRFSEIASPASRAEDVDVLGSFTAHLATSMGLTAAARDLVDDRELLAPARAVNRQVRDRFPEATNLGSIVSAADIHQGRAITIPPVARDLVREPLDAAYTASAEAVRRSAAFDPIYRSPAPQSPSQGVPRPDQAHVLGRRPDAPGVDR